MCDERPQTREKTARAMHDGKGKSWDSADTKTWRLAEASDKKQKPGRHKRKPAKETNRPNQKADKEEHKKPNPLKDPRKVS